MKTVLYLASINSDLTGGTKYNRKFIEILQANSEFRVDVLEDKDFGHANGLRWFEAIKVYRNLYKLCAKYDYVFINSNKCKQLYFHINKMISKNKNTKFLTFHHHYEFHTANKFTRFLTKHIELKFLNKMDYIIYASEYTYNLHKQYINDRVKKILIKVAVKTHQSEKSSWQGNQMVTMGGVGYGKRKGHLEMVEALNLIKEDIPDFTVKIIGNYDKNDASIKEVCQKLKTYNLEQHFEYVGRVSEEEKYTILENSKFYIFPSQYEGYGLSVIEAQSAGLPIIAFNNSAMPTIIENNVTGFLCNSIQEFANKIKLLYNNDDMCKNFGQNALNAYKKVQTENGFVLDVNNFIAKELNNK